MRRNDEEWVRLFSIDEIKGDSDYASGYSKKLKPDFLKLHIRRWWWTREHFPSSFVR